jgi:hypothetical protein
VDIAQIVQTASFVIAIAGLAAIALQRGITTSLREQVGDSKGRIEFLERERADDKALITQQAADIAALKRVVTGEVHWTSISDLLDHHHKLSIEHQRRTEQLLEQIRDEVRDSK